MQVKIFSKNGSETSSTIELNPNVFEVEISEGSVYYALNNELANRRVGTACTKTRAEVNYSNNKPFKQKGTGNARRGDPKSPVLVGGGTIFGPRPRDYSYKLPKNVKRSAFRSLLSYAVKENRLTVLEDFDIESGKTKDMANIVEKFSTNKERTVVIISDDHTLIRRSSANIPYLHVLAYNKLSAKELFYGKKILVLESAVNNLNKFYDDNVNVEGAEE